ncbi:hypothetical protein M011DRAFT_402907 [Sporormia fimetaria CBS 119925]|uniref:Ribosomal protein L9 domain-containing protein n=1 Tax=Sporormia fimetaria CBS 119925 TaxID=1340428 RepID=A0A6A6VCC7_9PLEO|nr:hypothetical protein M011DRAFT_402907 [Sporormia fimetaria CBS 119925]
MASLGRSALLPQCSACTRRITQLSWAEARQPFQQQVRCKTKAARQAERDVVAVLLNDTPRYGAAGTYITLNPAIMRNKWFPQRLADYVPWQKVKQLKKDNVTIGRDPEFGVQRALQEDEVEDSELVQQRKPYVRPVEIDFISPERSMELLTTFIPPTIEFSRQRIEQDEVESKPRYGASNAADILTAAAMASKPKVSKNAIYGSVSTADVVSTIKAALSHNDEAARVVVSENDVRFVQKGADSDPTKIKELGTFKVEIKVPGAEEPLIRTVRVRARKAEEQ